MPMKEYEEKKRLHELGLWDEMTPKIKYNKLNLKRRSLK
jgi:hypothetical protein